MIYNNQSDNELFKELLDYTTQSDKLHTQAKGLSHHVKLNTDSWGFTSWNAGSVSFNPSRIVEQSEKLMNENLNDLINGLNTTVRPKKFESLNNVILLQGIKESIDRDIGAVSSELDYSSIGTSSTAESESQTDLQSEFTDSAYARRQFSVNGSRTRVNQTMKMGMLWDDTFFDSVPVTIREAGVHWHLSDASKCHARVISTDFVLDAGDLFVVQVNELQENGTL
tara:strand:- start:40 stop:714 length:675 start_codon:yes stop_codon:yes gene_type:complete